jgi:hypothetical protein
MRIAIRLQLIEDAAAGPNLEAGHDVGRVEELV